MNKTRLEESNWPEISQPLNELAQQLAVIGSEQIPLLQATGRVLTSALTADRDSPAADLSAMDGYALQLAQLSATKPLRVAGRSVPGSLPPDMVPESVMQVFTGAIVPADFDLVVRREDTDETIPGIVKLLDSARTGRVGDNIRRRGENANTGTTVCESGSVINAPIIAVGTNFGAHTVSVAKKIRVAILTTGNELLPINSSVEPWQIRDSNGPSLWSLFDRYHYLDVALPESVHDDPSELRKKLLHVLEHADAVFLTGGVSMGDYDFVPDTIKACNGEIIFHKLPIRPGKPILGAVGPHGQLIVGLPGNPVSALVCAARFGIPLLNQMAGIRTSLSLTLVHVANADEKTLALHWFRLVDVVAPSVVEIVASKGSGDLVSLARSRGFIHLPPGSSGNGPWSYWSWD